MPYLCMSFGWYQELQREKTAGSLDAAVTELSHMLDQGAMIVHIYRDNDRENPEIVGRHSRLRSFITAEEGEPSLQPSSLPHEIERFLLDDDALHAWMSAKESGSLLDQCWSVVDLYPPNGPKPTSFYGRALLSTSTLADSSPQTANADRRQAHI